LPLVHFLPKELLSESKNIFDNLPTLLAPKKSALQDDLDRFLSTDPEEVTDVLLWWYEHKHIYPHLYRMALDYLSIPGKCYISAVATYTDWSQATSVHVERVFSQGRILLSHIRSRLSVQSTRALMCLGVWSLMGYVKDTDIKPTAILPEVIGDEEELKDGWDDI